MTQTIAVFGGDGYTGWPLACNLLSRGDHVVAVDDLSRRKRAGASVTPIADVDDRVAAVNEHFEGKLDFYEADLTTFENVYNVLASYEPDTVVNLAQIPSAPFSMRTLHEAWTTQQNNIQGSLNLFWAINEQDLGTHVVQLATMGEYPLGDDIPEGFLADGRPAPKEPGSLYHSSKVATTVNSLFLSRTWDIPTTEVYQGIVYGVSMFEDVDERLITRFDVDSVFGTVLNRFTAQAAVDHPMTVYGQGGQKRAMLSLADCIQCLTLTIDNPPTPGDRYPYRAINQFDGSYRVDELAAMVHRHTGADIEHIENPRVEDDSHHVYDPEREVLDELGYEPTRPLEDEFRRTYNIIEGYADRITESELRPSVRWRPEAEDPVEVADGGDDCIDLPDGGGCVEAWEAFSEHRRG